MVCVLIFQFQRQCNLFVLIDEVNAVGIRVDNRPLAECIGVRGPLGPRFHRLNSEARPIEAGLVDLLNTPEWAEAKIVGVCVCVCVCEPHITSVTHALVVIIQQEMRILLL